MRFDLLVESLLNEVRVINSKNWKDHPPLKDNETIRVYHGFNNQNDLFYALRYGTSGKLYADRLYSYEYNNNPKGIFVTTDFNIAKRFSHKVIMELNVKVSDLESPVWPSGNYTVQGGYSEYWKGETIDDMMKQREDYRLKKRENIKNNSEFEFVKNSDRPELANELYLSGEKQALFTGDLNKNSIRAIWVSKDFQTSGEFAPWQRMNLNDFIKKFDVKNQKLDNNKHETGRVFKPRDKFDSNIFIDKVLIGHNDKFEFLKEITPALKQLSDRELLKFVWPNQLDDLKKFINSL